MIRASILSDEEQGKIATFLEGRQTDQVPECMSAVIGEWILRVQDAMPDAMRNSNEWRRLLPYAAGTERTRESARLAIILDWMWTTVLPILQPIADTQGYGRQWATMCRTRTATAAYTAAAARYTDAAIWATFNPINLLARLIEA